eukprot:IDg9809t1
MAELTRSVSTGPGKRKSAAWSVKGVARWALGRRKSRRFSRGVSSSSDDMCSSARKHDRAFGRNASVVGLTEKEHQRHVAALDGAAAYRLSAVSPAQPRPQCKRCAARRLRLGEIRSEFERLRSQIISDDIVSMAPCDPDAEPEVVELIQESAKLRITIDTLMRFQVRRVVPPPSFSLRRRTFLTSFSLSSCSSRVVSTCCPPRAWRSNPTPKRPACVQSARSMGRREKSKRKNCSSDRVFTSPKLRQTSASSLCFTLPFDASLFPPITSHLAVP